MSAAAGQFALADLLTRAGAHIHGRRADCPRCKRRRTVSFDESKGVYHCHGAGCEFSGGAAKLARELGLATRLTAAEYRELCQGRERADRAARALYERVKARRFELLDHLHSLNRFESQARELGMNDSAAWDTLERVYRERPIALAELAILENCGAADLLRFLGASPERREREVGRLMMRGWVHDSRGGLVEVSW